MDKRKAIRIIRAELEKWIKLAEGALDFKGFYVIEEKKGDFGAEWLEFRYDSELYELIYYYQTDGYNPSNLGKLFDEMCDRVEKETGWTYEFESDSIINFYKP